MVSAVRFSGIAFIQLVKVGHFRTAVCKSYITEGRDAVPFPVLQVLDQPVTKEKAQVAGIIGSKLFLFFRKGKYLVGKIFFPVIEDRVDYPFF